MRWVRLRSSKRFSIPCLVRIPSTELSDHVLRCRLVFIIRFAERRIDSLLDAALLDYSPLSSEFESIQFESEWSFLRSFGAGKKKANGAASSANTVRGAPPMSPTQASRPPSPPPLGTSPPNAGTFASFRQTLSRARAPSSATPLQSLFSDPLHPPPTSPKDMISFMTALHTLLILSGINPALVTQFWSQVMYWTACTLHPLFFRGLVLSPF